MIWAFRLPSLGRAAKRAANLLTGPQRPFQSCRRFLRGLRGHVCVGVESDGHSFTPNESSGEFSQEACSVVAPQFDRVAQAQTREDGTEFVDAGRINDAAEKAFIR